MQEEKRFDVIILSVQVGVVVRRYLAKKAALVVLAADENDRCLDEAGDEGIHTHAQAVTKLEGHPANTFNLERQQNTYLIREYF